MYILNKIEIKNRNKQSKQKFIKTFPAILFFNNNVKINAEIRKNNRIYILVDMSVLTSSI